MTMPTWGRLIRGRNSAVGTFLYRHTAMLSTESWTPHARLHWVCPEWIEGLFFASYLSACQKKRVKPVTRGMGTHLKMHHFFFFLSLQRPNTLSFNLKWKVRSMLKRIQCKQESISWFKCLVEEPKLSTWKPTGRIDYNKRGVFFYILTLSLVMLG